MKLRDLAAVLMAAASLIASVTGLVTAVKAKDEVRAVDERLYDQAAQGIGDNADEVYRLKERLAALEGGRR